MRLSRRVLSQARLVERACSGVDRHLPPRNKALVAPDLPSLKDWAVFAFFGLYTHRIPQVPGAPRVST